MMKKLVVKIALISGATSCIDQGMSSGFIKEGAT